MLVPKALGDGSVNRFRQRRGRLLRRQIDDLARHYGRDIVILDVGGRPDYWGNVGVERIARIEVVNYNEAALVRELPPGVPAGLFSFRVGDARDLSDVPDQSVDLLHANSVIEHVGLWRDMQAMAREVRRVGRSGWVQTPAWSFPIEPHFRAPFLHWFGEPLRARMMSLSIRPNFRRMNVHQRRRALETANLLSRREMEALFPDCPLYVERLLIAKSYTARWMPEGVPLSRRPA